LGEDEDKDFDAMWITQDLRDFQSPLYYFLPFLIFTTPFHVFFRGFFFSDVVVAFCSNVECAHCKPHVTCSLCAAYNDGSSSAP
jgi:hypothetical protein